MELVGPHAERCNVARERGARVVLLNLLLHEVVEEELALSLEGGDALALAPVEKLELLVGLRRLGGLLGQLQLECLHDGRLL